MKGTASKKTARRKGGSHGEEAAPPPEQGRGLAQMTGIVGQWVETEEGIRRDEGAKLIRRLTASVEGRFHELATAEAGWSTLYRDPADGRLWEKTFPQSELHGGGPPRLDVLSEEDARAKYGDGTFAPTAPSPREEKKRTASQSARSPRTATHPSKPQKFHMPERKVYHVTTHEEGWQVKGEGASRASSVHKTKEKAVSAGRSLAKKPSEGQIKIHKQDGTIETEHTYKNDPTSSPG